MRLLHVSVAILSAFLVYVAVSRIGAPDAQPRGETLVAVR